MVVVGLSTLRYVVLRHEGVPEPHFDFMLEVTVCEDLLSWRALHWPPTTGDYFVRLPDHRNAYLEYEGPVSRGRGVVRRVAAGTCEAQFGDGLLTVNFPEGWELTAVKDSPGQWYCAVI